MRIFVAGATGALGRRLVPLLVANGHTVVGTTRTPAKASRLDGHLPAAPVLPNQRQRAVYRGSDRPPAS